MGYKRFIRNILDKFKKDHPEEEDDEFMIVKKDPQTLKEIIDTEFFYRKLDTVYLRNIMGMTFGLKKEHGISELKNEYTQLFAIRQYNGKTTIAVIGDEESPNPYSSDLMAIADRHGWRFIEKRPADIIFPVEPKGSNIIYCPTPQLLEMYRNEIDTDKDTTTIEQYLQNI